MNYWNLQTVVSEYSDPVQMVCEVLEMLNAPDVFNANFEDISRLQALSRQVSMICCCAKASKIKKKTSVSLVRI